LSTNTDNTEWRETQTTFGYSALLVVLLVLPRTHHKGTTNTIQSPTISTPHHQNNVYREGKTKEEGFCCFFTRVAQHPLKRHILYTKQHFAPLFSLFSFRFRSSLPPYHCSVLVGFSNNENTSNKTCINTKTKLSPKICFLFLRSKRRKKNSGFPCVFFVFHHQWFFFVFFLYFPPLFSLGAFSSLFSC
jgi:hypothetical protein